MQLCVCSKFMMSPLYISQSGHFGNFKSLCVLQLIWFPSHLCSIVRPQTCWTPLIVHFQNYMMSTLHKPVETIWEFQILVCTAAHLVFILLHHSHSQATHFLNTPPLVHFHNSGWAHYISQSGHFENFKSLCALTTHTGPKPHVVWDEDLLSLV